MLNCKEFWETWGQTNALYNAWTVTHKINYYVLFVLYTLDSHSSMTQKKICEYTGITKQTVNSVIRNLKKDGYVILSSCLEDKRERKVILTKKGSIYAKKILTPLYEFESNIFSIMGNDRVKQMIGSITLFNTIFEKNLKIDEENSDE